MRKLEYLKTTIEALNLISTSKLELARILILQVALDNNDELLDEIQRELDNIIDRYLT